MTDEIMVTKSEFSISPDQLEDLVEKYRQREYSDDIEFLEKEL